jgi:energy-coupling factor transport system permease protein
MGVCGPLLKGLFYEDKGLFLQTLHPLAALLYLGVLMVLSLVFTNPLYLAAVFGVIVFGLQAAEGLEAWEGYMKYALLLALLVIAVNALVSRAGSTILFSGPYIPVFGQLSVSAEAICYGAAMSLRLLNIISVFCLYNMVVQPDRMLNLFARFAGNSALVASLCTRLFPSLLKELDNIRDVQRVRGVDLQAGSVKEKIKKNSSIINILLVSSLEDSLGIAESMQARAFGSGPRSIYSRNIWRPRDWLCLAAAVCSLGIAVWAVAGGAGAYNYYPVLDRLIKDSLTMVYLAGTVICLSVPVALSWGWKHCHYIKSKI